MLNIIRRPKENPTVRTREPEQTRWMRDFFDWDPFREMVPGWFGPTVAEPVFAPAFEVKENPEAFVFKADLPGIKEADVEVKLDGNRLTIAGKREAELETREDTYYAYERNYGRFQRAFTLPEGIDAEHVKATLEHGVLTVAIPKLPAAVAKKIEVKAAEKKS
jgi:HSP20 family protein